MKKMLLVLAGMACLGALASCKNDAEELTIKFADDGYEWSYKYAGDATGTVAYVGNSTYYAYSVKIDPDSLAMLQYEDDNDVKSNMKAYQLTVPVILTTLYAGTGESASVQNSVVAIYVKKVGGEYYASGSNYSLGDRVSLSGSPESSEFSLSGLISSDSYVFSSITFRRK